MTWPPIKAKSGPLAGVKVLDLSRILAGPFSTTILSDLGADVIKVERPGAGDDTRRWGPPFAPSGDAAYFYSCNRGRRSLTLDLADAATRELVLDLVGEADVLVENFLPGAMDRLGLGRDVLTACNPRLVHCVISGYGHASTRARWPALDFVIQAHAGILGVTGPDPDHPTKAGVPIVDLAAGLYASIGILAALREADRTGQGRHVEVALADAGASLLVNHAMNYLIGGRDAVPFGNAHPSVVPYETVRTADRLMAIAAATEAQFARLCGVVGLPDAPEDDRFRTNHDRVANRPQLIAQLEERLASRPAADWVVALNEAGVAAAVVNSAGEALDDRDLRERLVTYIADGDEPIPQLRVPIWLDGAPVEPRAAPPRLGADDHLVADRAPDVGR